jgi:hypothetical protein
MTTLLSVQPLLFEPSFEQIPEDESHTSHDLAEAMRSILETTYHDYGHAVRSVHAKAHGLLYGEIQVVDNLPPELAQGMFAKPVKLPVALRFSTNPGDILDDKVSAPRGLAIKIIGVEGSRLPGSERDVTQDFVLQNAKVFTAADPKSFLKTLKMLAKTTDKAPGSKKAFSAVLRGVESIVEAVGGESATLKSLGGHPITHLLGETYYSVVPFLYGPYYAKLSVVPISAELTALTDKTVDLNGNPDGLRAAVQDYFSTNSGTWEVRIQLATDLEKMPIEDASAEWPEDVSPFVTVARIEVAQQQSWSQSREAEIDDGMAFSPWHGLAAHRPLGGVMRVRKPSYDMSSTFRGEHNGCPMSEPRALKSQMTE